MCKPALSLKWECLKHDTNVAKDQIASRHIATYAGIDETSQQQKQQLHCKGRRFWDSGDWSLSEDDLVPLADFVCLEDSIPCRAVLEHLPRRYWYAVPGRAQAESTLAPSTAPQTSRTCHRLANASC